MTSFDCVSRSHLQAAFSYCVKYMQNILQKISTDLTKTTSDFNNIVKFLHNVNYVNHTEKQNNEILHETHKEESKQEEHILQSI